MNQTGERGDRGCIVAADAELCIVYCEIRIHSDASVDDYEMGEWFLRSKGSNSSREPRSRSEAYVPNSFSGPDPSINSNNFAISPSSVWAVQLCLCV